MLDPVSAQQGATKAYVDATVTGHSNLVDVDVITFEEEIGTKLQLYGASDDYSIGVKPYELNLNTQQIFTVTRGGTNTQISTDINDNVTIPNGRLLMSNNSIENLGFASNAGSAINRAYGEIYFRPDVGVYNVSSWLASASGLQGIRGYTSPTLYAAGMKGIIECNLRFYCDSTSESNSVLCRLDHNLAWSGGSSSHNGALVYESPSGIYRNITGTFTNFYITQPFTITNTNTTLSTTILCDIFEDVIEDVYISFKITPTTLFTGT